MKNKYKLWLWRMLFLLFMLSGTWNSLVVRGAELYESALPSQGGDLEIQSNPQTGNLLNSANETNEFNSPFSDLANSSHLMLRGLPGLGDDEGGPGQGFIEEDDASVGRGWWILILLTLFYGLFNRFRQKKNMKLKKLFFLLGLFLLPAMANAQLTVELSQVDGNGYAQNFKKLIIQMGTEVAFHAKITNTGTGTVDLSNKPLTVSIVASDVSYLMDNEWRFTSFTYNGSTSAIISGNKDKNSYTATLNFPSGTTLAPDASLEVVLKAFPLENCAGDPKLEAVKNKRFLEFKLDNTKLTSSKSLEIENINSLAYSFELLQSALYLKKKQEGEIGLTMTLGEASESGRYSDYIRVKIPTDKLKGLQIIKVQMSKQDGGNWSAPVDITPNVSPSGSQAKLITNDGNYYYYELNPDLLNAVLGHGYLSATDKIKIITTVKRDSGCPEIIEFTQTVEDGNGTDFHVLPGAMAQTTDVTFIDESPSFSTASKIVWPQCPGGKGYLYYYCYVEPTSNGPAKNISFEVGRESDDYIFTNAWIGNVMDESATDNQWIAGDLTLLTRTVNARKNSVFTFENLTGSTAAKYTEITRLDRTDNGGKRPGLSDLDGDGIYNDLNVST